MKDETVITYMNWNKKESTYINKICLQIQKKWNYINSHYPKKKKKNYGLSFIWSLDLGALSIASGGISFSFSLEVPSTGKVVEASSFSKFWEAALGWRASATLSEEAPCGASGSLACSCWLDRGGFWGWASSVGWVTKGAASFRLGTRRAGGKKIFSGLLSSKEASIPA